MKMNMWEFKRVLKRASINYLIPGIHLTFKDGKIQSSSVSKDNNAIVILEIDDTVLDNKRDEELEFSFANISSNLKPYLELLKDEEVDINISDSKIVIEDSNRSKVDLWLSGAKEFTNHFSGEDRSDQFDYFYENLLSENILTKFNEIKKIAMKFQKIYFVCEDGKLYIQSTDKTNQFCNSVKFEVDDAIQDSRNLSMCFDFKNITYILSTIEDDINNFRLKCSWLEESDAGMLLFENINTNEKFFIMSKNE